MNIATEDYQLLKSVGIVSLYLGIMAITGSIPKYSTNEYVLIFSVLLCGELRISHHITPQCAAHTSNNRAVLTNNTRSK